MTFTDPLPALEAQVERIVELGLAGRTGVSISDLQQTASAGPPGALLVIHPDLAPASALAPLLRRSGKPGFVVVDMSDVDQFKPISDVSVPADQTCLLTGINRGDQLANWSPVEALPAIIDAGRTPLLLSEGIQWLLHQPDALQRNHCFMAIGSRRRKPTGLDTRTPAIWVSNGTGRDGGTNRNAPKIGWCWAGNRHTWLGFATAHTRQASPKLEPVS